MKLRNVDSWDKFINKYISKNKEYSNEIEAFAKSEAGNSAKKITESARKTFNIKNNQMIEYKNTQASLYPSEFAFVRERVQKLNGSEDIATQIGYTPLTSVNGKRHKQIIYLYFTWNNHTLVYIKDMGCSGNTYILNQQGKICGQCFDLCFVSKDLYKTTDVDPEILTTLSRRVFTFDRLVRTILKKRYDY
jgi:hypothetical protein